MALNLRVYDQARWIFPMDSAVDPSWRTPESINEYQETFFKSMDPPEGMLLEGAQPGVFNVNPLSAKVYDIAKRLGPGVEQNKLVCEYGLVGWENMYIEKGGAIVPMKFRTVKAELATTKAAEECIDFLGFFDQLREGLARAIMNLTASGE